jgi:predicted transcriptional regulator
MKILTIKVEEPKKVARKLLRTLEGINNGNTPKGENVLTFPSVEKLFKTLTPVRWKIVKALQTREFQSIRELAKYLKRDYANVWRDIQILNDLGIVKIEKTGKGYRAYVPYDRVILEFPKTVEV